jgi:hypothetical protein
MLISLLNTLLCQHLHHSPLLLTPYTFLPQIVHLNFEHSTIAHCLIPFITLALYSAGSYRVYIAILKIYHIVIRFIHDILYALGQCWSGESQSLPLLDRPVGVY